MQPERGAHNLRVYMFRLRLVGSPRPYSGSPTEASAKSSEAGRFIASIRFRPGLVTVCPA